MPIGMISPYGGTTAPPSWLICDGREVAIALYQNLFSAIEYNFKDHIDIIQKRKFSQNDIKAFSILGLSVGLKWEYVQKKFKKLVKKFHPDMNLGNKKYEDKLKVITLAYTQLKNTYRINSDA